MKIEEALQQTKKFKSPLEKVIVNINYTSAKIQTHQAILMNEYEISIQQYNLLRILRGAGGRPVTVKYLIERMIDKSSNASRLVDKLVGKGHVNRYQCPQDRRQVDVEISSRGLLMLEEIDLRMKTEMKNFSALSSSELSTLSDMLDKLREGLD